MKLKSYTCRPNSDLMDCLLEVEVTFGNTTAKVDRIIQLSQRDVLGDNPAWTEDDLRVACTAVLATEVVLVERPAAEVAVLEAIELLTNPSGSVN